MRVPIRTSGWARWASRAARLALPVIVIAVFMHRAALIDSTTFLAAAGAAFLMGLLGFAIGLAAYIRIWITGDRGWRPASIGVATGLVFIVPLVMAASLGARYPDVHDVSTDMENPPRILGAVRFGPGIGFDDPALGAALREAFPNVTARDYPLPPREAWAQVLELVELRGWRVLGRRGPEESPGPGQINAVAMTWLGWRDEVAIRVDYHPGGSRVDMRSASYEGGHDLGANGLRIEAFLLELDMRATERTHELGLIVPGG